MAIIGKALLHPRQQSDLAIGLAKQQRSAFRTQLPLVKPSAHLL
jgi:hypothetical protein